MKKKANKRSSETVNAKKPPKKMNPFEIHVNRKKFNVIGMKSKADKGLPGVSRSKAIKKRKVTLLQEYKLKDKKNTFVDRRIGERNKAMTAEDKIVARYTAERMKLHSKKSRYNLGDTEELTHWGQSISEVEKFDDPRSDDDDDDDGKGKLDSDFVEDAHFGGGMLKKADGDGYSRQNLIDQLIAESKKRKLEKQRLREQTIDLTQKLDSEWKELLPLVTAVKRSKVEEEQEVKKDDKFASYDKLSKQLKFEPRAKASDRLKSEEEIAKEEKERLEKLEKERLERMLGDSDVKVKKQHRSADDLDDGFVINGVGISSEEDKRDGINNEEKSSDDEGQEEDEEKSEDGDVEEEEEEVEVEEMEIEPDGEDGEVHGEGKEGEEENEEDESVNEDEDKEEEGEKSEVETHNKEEPSEDESLDLSDLKESDESEDEDLVTSTEKKEEENVEKKLKIDKEDQAKKVIIDKAINELPYTFKIPSTYKEFEKLLRNKVPDVQAVIIERMIKCNHPSLKREKNEKLDTLYTYLLQHLQDYATEEDLRNDCFKVLDKLSPWLYDLTQWAPDNATFDILEVIKEKYADFLKNKKNFPGLDTLIFLKVVSILYPTSDFRHKIVTPCLIFIEEMLSSCRVRSSIDVSTGLLITTLALEYCSLSKRYVPEAINFLRGILRLAHSKQLKIPTVPPFKLKDIDSYSLEVTDKSISCDNLKLNINDLFKENNEDEFKIRSINLALNLLNQFCQFWNEEPSSVLIFEPFVPLLNVENYPVCLREKIEEVLKNILKLKKNKLIKLMLEKKKPKPLRLYEPEIEQVYTFKKHRPMTEERKEHAKLLHKVKEETKGALREIRRDREFLTKLRFKEAVKSDEQRKRKVKEIYGSAAQQMGELRKLSKKKKK